MGQASQLHVPGDHSGSRELSSDSALTQMSPCALDFSNLSGTERSTFISNLERVRSGIETFCEQVHKLIVTPIEELASKPSISFKELRACYVTSWETYRTLLEDFDRATTYYRRELDPGKVGVYYAELTQETHACLFKLSNVVTLDQSLWAAELKNIVADYRAALSLDTTLVSGEIRNNLQILRSLNADNPEAL